MDSTELIAVGAGAVGCLADDSVIVCRFTSHLRICSHEGFEPKRCLKFLSGGRVLSAGDLV